MTSSQNTPTRRLALLFGCALSTAAQAKPEASAELARRADEANQAFMRGDMRRWHALVSPIAADFTLMQPFGGPFSRGFDPSAAHLEAMARRFRNGEGVLEIVASYAAADMVALVFIERQHGEVGGLPDQDWSLRVTQIYRKDRGAWALVHRHADPLVRPLGLERTAALARGAPAV